MHRLSTTQYSREDGGDGAAGGSGPPDCTAAELFDALWATLADGIGPTATATLLQRSIKRAGVRHVGNVPVIRRDNFTYVYTVPASWHAGGAAPLDGLRRIAAELVPLLTELTGHVIVRRLNEVPGLKRCGVLREAS